MTHRRALGAVGLLALVAATGLALLGRAVLALSGTTAPARPARVAATPHSAGVADRLAMRLLETGDARAFARIVQIYDDAVGFMATAGDAKGPIRIATLIPRLHSISEEAQALMMAGTLLAYSAGAGFGASLPPELQAPTLVVLEQAVADYRAAIRLEPGAETAKFDLELLLRQLQRPRRHAPAPGKTKRPPKHGKGTGKTPKGSLGQEHHAGIYAVGSGY